MSKIGVDEFEAMAQAQLPLVAQLGISVEHLEQGRAWLRLPFSDALLRPGGTIAGPALMALADAAMYAAVLSMIGKVALAVTINLTCNFLRRPVPADVIADARILKLGKRLTFGEVTLYSEGDGDPIAHVTSTYSIPPKGDEE